MNGKSLRRACGALAAVALGLSTLLVGPAPASAGASNIYISVLTPSDVIGPKVLDIANWSRDDRGPAHLWHLETTGNFSNQRWDVVASYEPGMDNVVELRNRNSGKCLDKSMDRGNYDGAPVYQYTCSGEDNQQWHFVDVVPGSKWGWLVNVADGRCLDVRDVNYSDGAPLQVWTCKNSWNQRWNVF